VRFEYPYNFEDVYNAVIEAISNIRGMRIEVADKINGFVMVETGMSLTSDGEDIKISLLENIPNRTRVEINSTLKTYSIMGRGKNKANIEKIMNNTSKILSRKQPARAIPHKVCPRCGTSNDWEYVFCGKCGSSLRSYGSSPGVAPAKVATHAPTKFLIKCPHCGTELSSSRRNWSYCPNCSFPIGSAGSYVYRKQSVPPSGERAGPLSGKEPISHRMNFYEILGIKQNASQKEIEDVYRALVKIYHSDHQGTYRGVNGDKKFIEINEAYQTLKDPVLREKYNNRLRSRDKDLV